MTENSENLTHHEELRLDYLRKNIHYLNENEERELQYLEQRALGLVRPSRKASRPKPSYSELPSYRKDHEVTYRPSLKCDEDEILPAYPREERRRKAKKVKNKPKKQPLIPEAVQPEPKPKVRKPRKKVNWFMRIIKLLLLAVLLLVGALVFMFFKGYNSVDNKAHAVAFHGQKARDGINILVLGTDGRNGGDGEIMHTDSMMVVNINNSDKKVKMVSFMRDTLVTIEGEDYKLNLAYTLGEQVGIPGPENLRQVLSENFDIQIDQYAMIDFSTFATVIDTIFPEGVEMDAKFSTIDGLEVSSVEVPDDLGFASGGSLYQTIQVGKQRMNGKTLLNYARFRKDDEGDFGRTRRQQEVMAAIMTQVKNPSKLFSGSEALGKVYALTPSTMNSTFLLTKGLPAMLDASNGIERTTVPEEGDWVDGYDVYGGLGLQIDFDKYRNKLAELGFR